MNEAPAPIACLPTGVPGLDDLLEGGLAVGRTVLLKGTPGTGKTTLGLQMLVAGAERFGQPGIVLSFEQLPEQIEQDGAALGWDLAALRRAGKLQTVFVRPDDILDQPGRQENRLLVQIADWVDERGAGRILIDSISHLRPLFAGDQARALFMRFLVQLKALGLTPLLTSEWAPADGGAMDAYLVDAVIQLHRTAGVGGRGERRFIEIVKTRGRPHVGGLHPFEIGPGGVTIFPRIEPAATPSVVPPTGLLSTGIVGLDAMLGGGFAPASTLYVAGLSGTFKTALAAHTALAAGEGRGAIWVALAEAPAALERHMEALGLPLARAREQGRLTFLPCVPGRDPVEKLLARLMERIDAGAIDRVVIDGMNELTAAEEDDARRIEAVAWLLRRLRARGVATVMTQRLARVSGRNPLGDIAWPGLADTIVYLGLVEVEGRLEKAISVLKHRGGPAAGDLRAIEAARGGLHVISDRFTGLSGVLEGSPHLKRKNAHDERP